MRHTHACLTTLFLAPAFLSAGNLDSNCTYKSKKLWGKVKIVTSFPDIRVKVMSSFPDLKVQFVESFPNVKIQYVDAFPGVR